MAPDHRYPILLATLLIAGCERYPEQPIFVYGQALQGEGVPLREAELSFDRREETYSPSPSDDSAPAFTSYGKVITQADGTFTLELPARDVEQVVSTSLRKYRFRVSTPPDEKGQAALLSFTFNAQDVELPMLRPWDAGLAVSEGASGPVVTFASPPSAPEKPPSAKLPVFIGASNEEPVAPTNPEPVLRLLSGEAVFWQELAGTGAWTPPAWALEDFASPEVQLRALSLGEWWFEPLWAESSQVTFRLEWRSARQPLSRGTLLPLSRGASCEPWWQRGVCPWTDGQLTSASLVDTPNPTEVGVVLVAPARPSRAVIRGLQAEAGPFVGPTSIVLEGSEDGANWHPLGSTPVPRSWLMDPMDPFAFLGQQWADDSPFDGPLLLNGAPLFLSVPLSSPAPVRHVRLYALSAQGSRKVLHSLAELSLFE